MELRLDRIDDAYHFRMTNSYGQTVDTDLQPAGGGKGEGVSPLELMLAGLGSCSGLDVVSILEKGKQHVESFGAVVTAERDGGKPISMITAMHVHFELTGELDPAKVSRAIRLSLETYCTVARILSATITITTSFSINGVRSGA